MKKAVVLATVVGLATLAVSLYLSPSDRREAEPAGGVAEQAAPAAGTSGDLVKAERQEVTALEIKTNADFLAEYWGSEWPEVREAMEAGGIDLNAPCEVTPWEIAAAEIEPLIPLNDEQRKAQIQSIISWPVGESVEAKSAWLAQNCEATGPSLDQSALDEIESIAREANVSLAELSQAWVTGIDFHMRRMWQDGDFLKAPLSTLGQQPRSGFVSAIHAAGSWNVILSLDKDSFPDLWETTKSASRLRAERNRAVQGYLHSRN